MNRHRFIIILLLVVAVWVDASANGILRLPRPFMDDQMFRLKEARVDVEIHDQVAITTVTDIFASPLDTASDPWFHFRLPAEASVTRFRYWRGEEAIEYHLGVGEQGGPGGGAQDNQVLRNYLGNNSLSIFVDSVLAGDVKIELQFAELLPYNFNVVRYTYPLQLGNFQIGRIDTVAITMHITSQRLMTSVSGVGNLAAQTRFTMPNNREAIVTCNLMNASPNSDWQVDIRFNQEDIGGWIYTHRSDTTQEGFFMLVAEPGIVDTNEQVAKYFTFVLDRSGSMQGPKMTQAKAAAVACLRKLVPADHFNIIDFAADVRYFRNVMLTGTNANVQAAVDYVNGRVAAGLTNTYGALTTAVGQEMAQGTANQVVFLTDGNPTAGVVQDNGGILNGVHDANDWNARIFSFGIGADLNRQLLTSLAQQNRGLCYIFDPNNARVDSVVNDFYQYFATPALVNPQVTFGEGLETDSLAPPVLQDLAAGRQLFLFGRYSTYGQFDVTLEGRMRNGDTTFSFPSMNFPQESATNAFIPRMWAKAYIDYLIDYIDAHGEVQAYINKVIELSLRFGILTRYTEYQPPPNEAVEKPTFAVVRAYSIEHGVEVTWQVKGVTKLVSFNLYRSVDGEAFVQINYNPIYGYRFVDSEPNIPRNVRYRVEMILDNEPVATMTTGLGGAPLAFELRAATPNPFNSSTSISYFTPTAGNISVVIYDIKGAMVERLESGYQSAGEHSVRWNASGASAGVYLVKVQLESGESLSQKLVLLR